MAPDLAKDIGQDARELVYQHVAEGDAARRDDLVEIAEVKEEHRSVRLRRTLVADDLKAGLKAIEARGRVADLRVGVSDLALLALVDVTNIAHDKLIAVRARDHVGGHLHPALGGKTGNRRSDLRAHVAVFVGDQVLEQHQVIRCEVLHRTLRAPAIEVPNAIVFLRVDDLELLVLPVAGEEDVARGLDGLAIALLLLHELVGNARLLVAELGNHGMQFVDLGDLRGLERPEPLDAASHALHEQVERAADRARRDDHDHHAEQQRHDRRPKHAQGERRAPTKDRALWHQPDERPARVAIRDPRIVERDVALERIDGLPAEGRAVDAKQPVAAGVAKAEGAARAGDGVIDGTLARHAGVGAVIVAKGKHVARRVVAGELVGGKVALCQVLDRDFDAHHGKHLAVHAQRHRIGDHAVAVHGAVLENEGPRPVAEDAGGDVRAAIARLERLEEEVVRVARACGLEVDGGRPGGIERDAELLGQRLLAAFKEQVRAALGDHAGVGVAKEEADVARGHGGVVCVGHHEEDAARSDARQGVRKALVRRLDIGALGLCVREELRRALAAGLELVGEQAFVVGGVLPNSGPLVDHGALQDNGMVFHGARVEVDDALLHLRTGARHDEHGDRHRGDERDHDEQRHEERVHDRLRVPGSLARHASHVPPFRSARGRKGSASCRQRRPRERS